MAQESQQKNNTIRFDMNDEQKIRQKARKEYDVAKEFKLSKLPIHKFYSASEDSAKRQFNIGSKTDLTIFEVMLTKNKETNFDIINQVKDFLSLREDIEMKEDKEFTYSDGTLVQRFLVYCKSL